MKIKKSCGLVMPLMIMLMPMIARATSLDIKLDNGTSVCLTPVADNAVRVTIGDKIELPDLTYLADKVNTYSEKIKPEVKTHDEEAVVKFKEVDIKINRKTGIICFSGKDTGCALTQLSSTITPTTLHGTPTYAVSATFDSPQGEFLYGLGQFQDGYLNVKGLSRRLTQVNTQISVPYLLSNRGYAILWNNYGMTEFNPCDNMITLTQASAEGDATTVQVTGTEGTRTEVRRNNGFHGEFTIDEDGDYTILLDVGQKMARSHNLVIDSLTVLDAHNVWLPPTSSAIVSLKAGNHFVDAILEENDKPSMYFKKIEYTTEFMSPIAECIDYTVFIGTPDECIASYREITGQSPMLPSWAFGYVHCRERFHSSDEILRTAREFRNKQLPMDVIVQDWQWWDKSGWNSMEFDKDNYPDPASLVDSLHNMGNRLMLSVWSKVDESSVVGKEMASKGYFIPGTSWVDFFNPDAAAFYWSVFSSKLLKPYGIDSWWQDATEPENDDLEGRMINGGKTHGEIMRNTYPILVSNAVYEGSRKDAPDHRTLILTRSGVPGIQRYGSMLWSGDVGNDFKTLQTQLAGGLGLMAAGHPWWTYDAGGFFRPGDQYSDPKYHERFLRWLQIATFMPMMRVHGYMSDTEPWRYGDVVEKETRRQLELRYKLFPYIYTLAYDVANGGTMMRPLVMDFTSDPHALALNDQYMFGKAILVAPVMEEGVTDRTVYLPYTDGGWYNFHTDAYIGNPVGDLTVPITLSDIPVMVRAGSIIPMCSSMQSTASLDKTNMTLKIYAGADGDFTLYEDEGTNYNYENGEFVLTEIKWNDKDKMLTIGKPNGKYDGMPSQRTWNIEITYPDGSKKTSSISSEINNSHNLSF